MTQNTATVTNVSSSTSAVTLFAATSGARPHDATDTLSRVVFNDSTADLYLKYGASASSTSFTVIIGANGYWEAPPPAYDGLITGAWASVNGAARCTQVGP